MLLLRLLLLVILLMAAIAGGCGDGREYPVKASGQVFLNGQPLKFEGDGFIQVVPKNSRAATGRIDPQDGSFTLTTSVPGDGVMPGEHAVTVKVIAAGRGGNAVALLPEAYASTSSSGLTVTIDGPTDTLRIDLEGTLKMAPKKHNNLAGDDSGR